MIPRELRWEGDTRAHARVLTPAQRSELFDILTELATGPIPPRIPALRDDYVPEVYELHGTGFLLKAALYPEQVRVWVLRQYREE